MTSLSILSFNIFFDKINLKERTEKICSKILDIKADIVCLQEVIYNSYEIIREKLNNEYVLSYFYKDYREYFEIILVKNKKVQMSGSFKFHSYQNRGLSWIVIEDILVCTSHLESLSNNKKIRNTQLNQLFNFTQRYENWIFIGDTNCEDNDEILDILPEDSHIENFEDTWFAERFFGNNKTKDYDKAIVSNNLIVINKQNIEAKKDNIWLSDHNAILIEVEIKKIK